MDLAPPPSAPPRGRRTLGELLPRATLGGDVALATLPIDGLADDSRRVRPGALFFALPGLRHDGLAYADQAVAAGAVAVVAGAPASLYSRAGQAIPCVVVAYPVLALGQAASRWHGEPSTRLPLVGITGTNGKTTTSFLLEALLRAAGRRPGLLGTVCYRWEGHSEPAPFTTPTALVVQDALARMVTAGCDHAVMEVSSHGLAQGRLWGCSFAVAAFTQLTQDHLDLHGTMQRYFEAKRRLFDEHLRPGGAAVVHVDGPWGPAMAEAVRARPEVRLIRCSRHDPDAELRLSALETDLTGLRGLLHCGGEAQPFHVPLLGDFNAENLLVAAGCAHALGLSLAQTAAGLGTLRGVPGRLERVDEGNEGPVVLVDYAHTPDALARALATLRALQPRRLLVLFGCGGDRDRGKRPLMGQAAARGADLVIVSADNPRSEAPEAISAAIVEGLVSAGATALTRPELERDPTRPRYWVEPDRGRAIAAAIALLKPGDVLLIAGKGHEDYQLIGEQRLPFDDREQARQALAARPPRDGGRPCG